MSVRITALSASALLFGLSILPGVAQAKELDACGGVFLTAASQCEFKPKQDCQTTCSTTSVEQSCAEQTYTMCSGGCTMSETTECTQKHQTSCSMECDSISSKSSNEVCVSDCSNDCSAMCSSTSDAAGCQASCSHDCSKQCSSCSESDQSNDCNTKCMSVIDNECTAEVNRDCLIACQTNNYEDCKTNTVQTCNTTCQNKGGAIFCDGQFIDASDLQACADQLATEFSFNIDVNVNADATATVTTVSNDAKKTTAKCSFGAPPRNTNGILAAALGAVAIAVVRRRRRG